MEKTGWKEYDELTSHFQYIKEHPEEWLAAQSPARQHRLRNKLFLKKCWSCGTLFHETLTRCERLDSPQYCEKCKPNRKEVASEH